MGKQIKAKRELKIERPPRPKISAEEAIKRMVEFSKRKEKFIAAVRTGRPQDYLPELQ